MDIYVKLKGDTEEDQTSHMSFDDAVLESDDWAVYVIQYARKNRSKRTFIFPKNEIRFIRKMNRSEEPNE